MSRCYYSEDTEAPCSDDATYRVGCTTSDTDWEWNMCHYHATGTLDSWEDYESYDETALIKMKFYRLGEE
jgi:hypothetical protein